LSRAGFVLRGWSACLQCGLSTGSVKVGCHKNWIYFGRGCGKRAGPKGERSCRRSASAKCDSLFLLGHPSSGAVESPTLYSLRKMGRLAIRSDLANENPARYFRRRLGNLALLDTFRRGHSNHQASVEKNTRNTKLDHFPQCDFKPR